VTPDSILTLANLKNVDLLDLRVEDVDFDVLAEHLGKEARFNGATPGTFFSVAQHLCLGTDAILKHGGTELEAAYFHLHDCQEGIWKDDPTPKKVAIATRISERFGLMAGDILKVLDGIIDEHDAVIHRAAGLSWPLDPPTRRTVKLYDAIMFVTEWRDLMHDAPHPNWAPFSGIKPLKQTIDPWPWAQARAGWLYRAKRLLPALRKTEAP
jgi:hypothetical protein